MAAVILGIPVSRCDGVYPRTSDGRCQGCGTTVVPHPLPVVDGTCEPAAGPHVFIDEPIPYRIADVACPPSPAPPVRWDQPIVLDPRLRDVETVRAMLSFAGVSLDEDLVDRVLDDAAAAAEPAPIVDLELARSRRRGQP